MSNYTKTKQLSFTPYNNERLANLCGSLNEHISEIETYYGVQIAQRGNCFHITGSAQSINEAITFLNRLYLETNQNYLLTPSKVYMFFKEYQTKDREMPNPTQPAIRDTDTEFKINTKRMTIKPRGERQQRYVENMREKAINFAVGPAGTGKTYLAVACAVEALDKGKVQRLVLVRPAVEAGEKLGFLPGDLQEKVLPYLRPLYDALYDMLGFENVARMVERNIIEIAPLAFMRGRTLNDSFIILDEAQNTTEDQMKMFLTRLGFGSTIVITGDITQIDLAKGINSGLNHAVSVLKDIDGVSFNRFDAKDAVRHPLVKSIVEAYEKFSNDHE